MYFVVEVHPKYIRQVSIYARRFSQGVSGSMFLTATARDSESMAEDWEERFGTNFTFAKDRRSESKLSKSAGYALGLAAWFCRLVCKNYELLGWCCRAGRSTSYHAISQFFTFTPLLFTFLFFYSFTLYCLAGRVCVCPKNRNFAMRCHNATATETMSEYRKIIHVDMDCFFAAVELLDHPELAGRPVAVGHDAERGVVSTASYEARRYGVRSALSMAVAKRLCPQLVVMPPRMERYAEVSRQIHGIFSRYTDLIEPLSIDEAFLDVTRNKPGIPLAKDIAMEIKAAIRDELHLTASAGVSYCKLLAKIASDYNKPDGLCVVHPQHAISFLDNLRLEKLWLVGPKTARDMHSVGIFTVRQLRACSLTTLTRLFGKRGQMFYNFSRGIDDSEVQVEHERKSVSCEATFENDIWKRSAVIIELYHIVLELVVRLSKNDFQGRTLTLKIKFADFTTVTRSITADRPLVGKADILPLAKQLLARVSFNRDHPIRLLGLGVGRADDAAVPQQTWREQDLPFDEW